MTWKKAKLKDCCVSIADGDHQPPPKADAGVPFVTISNIDAFNTLSFENAMHVPREYYDGLDPKRRATTGDVLYSVVGSFGIPVLIKDDAPFVFQRHIAILRPDKSLLDSRFLYYTMRSKDFYHLADAAAIGAAQRTISLSALKNLEIPLPPLPVQRRIADILSAYDDLIENNRKQIKLLEEAAQRLYKEWFIDLRFPGHEHTPIINGVPEGWAVVPLKDLVEFNPPIEQTNDSLKQFIPMDAISESNMLIDDRKISVTNKNCGSKFKHGDTLFARITPCLENGKTAFVFKTKMGKYAVGSTEFIVLRAKEISPYMVYLMARMESFREYAINSMTGSDGRQRVQIDKLKIYSAFRPAKLQIERFSSEVSSMFFDIDKLAEKCARLSEARDCLLRKLMKRGIE